MVGEWISFEITEAFPGISIHNSSSSVVMVLLDIRPAFDSVVHRKLFDSLLQTDIGYFLLYRLVGPCNLEGLA